MEPESKGGGERASQANTRNAYGTVLVDIGGEVLPDGLAGTSGPLGRRHLLEEGEAKVDPSKERGSGRLACALAEKKR